MDTTRRRFLESTAALAAAPAFLSAQSVDNAIKVGLVGCGGRGTGAAAQALKADDYAELTAVADISIEAIDQSLEQVAANSSPEKVKVADDKKFLGLDAFQKVLDSDVDVVLLATPPGFRPDHLEAAVAAGKHLFVEKPIAVDSPGVRRVLEAVQRAEDANLSVCSGFCWRYSNYIQETFEQVHGGAIGDIRAYYATYYTSPVKPMPPASERPDGLTDMEWAVMNWYNFNWLAGDSIVEQAIHSADKIAWAMGDQPPISCVGVGGRQIPAEGGNIYDHFEVNYLYPNNVRAFLACRQIPGCFNENADFILGTTGACTIGKGPIPRIEGENRWMFRGEKYDMYQREHDVLFSSIRRGEPLRDGKRMAYSTLLGIMGRMAAYTGQEITWEQALNSQDVYFPVGMTMDTPPPDRPMALPGVTPVL